MKRKLILFTFLVVCIASAFIFGNPGQWAIKSIMRITRNYKTPKYESVDNIKEVASKLNYDRLYCLSSSKSMQDFDEKDIWSSGFLQIYNRDKQLLLAESGSECTWNLAAIFTSQDTMLLRATDTSMYNFVMDRIRPIDIRNPADTFQYYVYAGWVEFVPKLRDRMFKATTKMKDSLGNTICLNYVNLDVQEEWVNESLNNKK